MSPTRTAPAGALPAAVACAGCGYRAAANEPVPLRCPNSAPGDDVDHVITRRLDRSLVAFPHGVEANPFVRYRTLFYAYHVARAAGWTDAAYVALVDRLDASVARVDGHGFRVTPFARSAALSDWLGFSPRGGVWVKDETGNVSGSHKARHLMGTLLELEVADALARAPLAIASCGNAALAAAVVARAAGRTLDVFIPSGADAVVVAQLRALGARLATCERTPGAQGDPTYNRLLDALAAGAIPFTCQGNLNGMAIEGGETLGYELVDALEAAGARLDRLFVQVGGGALASSCVQAFAEAVELGEPVEPPRLHAVQTRGAYPLVRAYERLAERLLARARIAIPAGSAGRDERADVLRAALASAAGQEELAFAVRHRSEFMWPWETEPRSVAHGILDDETYDWAAVVRGMLATAGSPVIVAERTLVEANELARSATGIDVDPTGSAGLAGLIDLVRQGVVQPDETVGVLFTGIRRRPDAEAAAPTAAGGRAQPEEGRQP